MSESIIFRGTHIRYYDGRQEEGGAFVRIHLTAEFSQPVMEAMEWEEPGSSVTDAKLDGELHGTHLILTPGDKLLAGSEIQFAIRSAEDFKVVTVAEGDSKRRELRFIVRSSADGVAALVDQYIRVVGTHQGALKVSYVKQEQLPLTESKPDAPKPPAKAKSGCKNCDAGIPKKDNDDAEHVNGEPCKLWHDDHPALTAIVAGQTPTAAEKKKARLAEEAKKRELKTGAKGEWPEPNEHGVYEPSPEMTLEFFSKKCAAAIEYLQVGPHQWIAATSASYMDGGYGPPLTTHFIYPLKEVAIAKEAYIAAEKAEKAAETASAVGVKKQHQALREWFIEVFVKYSEGLEDGWMDRDYRVAEEEPEPVEAAG